MMTKVISHFTTATRLIGIVLVLLIMAACERDLVYEDLSDKSTREIYKIWDEAPHSSASDLIRFNDAFYCAFREGASASGAGGLVRIIKSTNGVDWETVQVVGIDAPVAPPPTELEFNGTNQYMTIPHHTDFDFENNGTFSLTTWVYRGSTALADLVSTWNGGNGYFLGATGTTLLLDLASQGTTPPALPRIHSRSQANGGTWFLTASNWYHLGFVFDGANQKIYLYQNGENIVLQSTQTNDIQKHAGNDVANTYGNDITVFAKTPNRTNPDAAVSRIWRGALRTMRFWNKALSPAEMAADVNAAVTAETPNLIAGYDFTHVEKRGSDNIVPDIKGNHDGILKNFIIADVESPGVDLKAPKLSVTPDNRLMLLVEGEIYSGGSVAVRRPYVSYSDANGANFSTMIRSDVHYPTGDGLSESNFWIWNLAWNNSRTVAYGFDHLNPLTLFRTTDGSTFRAERTILLEEGNPNEVTVKFDNQNNMYALIRRTVGSQRGLLAVSPPPYENFTYHQVEEQLGAGTNFVFLDDNTLGIATRISNNRTQVLVTDLEGNILKRMPFPSQGENGYPSLVVHDGFLWTSYHTSQAGKPEIYMAKVPLPYLLNH